MRLDEVMAAVSSQLDQQAALGVQISPLNEVPENGPIARGTWNQIRGVTAVFADLKNSTGLSANDTPDTAAYAYTYFIRAMAVILENFGTRYIDIQGDGIFGLFSGRDSEFRAAAAAITMRTSVERNVSARFNRSTSTVWDLTAGIGIDRGTLLVRKLGLRGTKQNEVWAGKPVNMAAKLSSVANSNQVVVSDRIFNIYQSASRLRQQVLLRSCGCGGSERNLWTSGPVRRNLGLDFTNAHRRRSAWCERHGSRLCEALITNIRPLGM